jgi:hypothetical protein
MLAYCQRTGVAIRPLQFFSGLCCQFFSGLCCRSGVGRSDSRMPLMASYGCQEAHPPMKVVLSALGAASGALALLGQFAAETRTHAEHHLAGLGTLEAASIPPAKFRGVLSTGNHQAAPTHPTPGSLRRAAMKRQVTTLALAATLALAQIGAAAAQLSTSGGTGQSSTSGGIGQRSTSGGTVQSSASGGTVQSSTSGGTGQSSTSGGIGRNTGQ